VYALEYESAKQMRDDVNDMETQCGQVKWFDPVKGFGFIVASEGGADVLLHANVLRNYGQSSIADGTTIWFKAQSTSRGLQAVVVVKIESALSVPINLSEEEDRLTTEELLQLPIQAARVKWFDKSKGFGFANVWGYAEDVFLHLEVVNHSGFADLQAGEAICLRVTDGKRGKMAVHVLSWDSAVSR
jgi:CspA family cold shock protein